MNTTEQLTEEEQDWLDRCECVRRQEANNRDFELNACEFGCMGPDGVCDYRFGREL